MQHTTPQSAEGGVDLGAITLDPIRLRTVAILGYGNQGRAHALNLRDSGVRVVIGARPGPGARQAEADGFFPQSPERAIETADTVLFLLPDQVIAASYRALAPSLRSRRAVIGFAHGFAYVFGGIERFDECRYFLVGPKGAGALLRENFTRGGGLPAVFALSPANDAELRGLALSYAKAIGCASSALIETSFQEEVEGDLFGEQAVLCGGLLELMEASFETLVRNGHPPETAFLDVAFEAVLILKLWLRHGPAGMARKISPTAFYGGLTRGRRVITPQVKAELQKIFDEVRSGAFAREWLSEVERGMPQLHQEQQRLAESPLQKAYERLAGGLGSSLKE